MGDEPFVWTFEAQAGPLFMEIEKDELESDEIQFYTMTEFSNPMPLERGTGGIISVDILQNLGQVTIKEFNWSSEQPLNKYKHEIELLAKHKHPNIVNLLGILWNGIDKSIYLGYVMEYVEGGSLQKIIYDKSKDYDSMQIYLWIEQITQGLKFLHKNGIIHRDIKPANILVADSNLKLADLGVAKTIDASTTQGAGTFFYMAPEMISLGKSSRASDIYSLAITIWEIFHRTPPYVDTENMGYAPSMKIVKGTRPYIDRKKVYGAAYGLIVRAWDSDPDSRPSLNKFIRMAAEKLDYLKKPTKDTIMLAGEHKLNKDYLLLTVFCQDESKWIPLRIRLPFSGRIYDSVYLNGEIYLIDSWGIYKLNEEWQWIWLTSMHAVSKTACCLAWNGYIWVLGGTNHNSISLNTVRRFDPRKNIWETMPNMIHPRSYAAATIWNNYLVICGGVSYSNRVTSTVEWFDPDIGEGSWSNLTKMPHSRCNHSLVCFQEKLIVMGGYNKHTYNTVWEMDPQIENSEWKTLPSMKYSSALFTGVVYNQKIYAIGGRPTREVEIGYVEIFDGKSWRRGPYLPVPLSSASPIIIPKELYPRLLKKSIKKHRKEVPATIIDLLFAMSFFVASFGCTTELIYPVNRLIAEIGILFGFWCISRI